MKTKILAPFVFLLTIALIFGAVHSQWGKEKMRQFLVGALKESKLPLQVEKIEGTIFEIELQGVSVETAGFNFSAKTLTLRPSFLRLLKNEIAFASIKGKDISFIEKKTPEELITPPKESNIWPIYVKKFSLENVNIPDWFSCNLQGRLRISSKGSAIDIKGTRPDFQAALLRLRIMISKKQFVRLNARVEVPTLDALSLVEPFDTSLALNISAKGPLSSFFQKKGKLSAAISGNFELKSLPLGTISPLLERSWKVSSRFQKEEEGSWTITRVSAKSDLFNAKGRASLDSNGQLQSTALQIYSEELLSLASSPIQGHIFTNINLYRENETLKMKSSFQIPTLFSDNLSIDNIKGTANAAFENETLSGSTFIKGKFLSQAWEMESGFSWKDGGSFFLSSLNLTSPLAHGEADLEIRTDKIFIGKAELSIPNLQSIQRLFPHLDAYGSATLRAELEPNQDLQAAHFDAEITNFYYDSFFSQKVSFYSDLMAPADAFQGQIYLDLEKGRWGSFYFDNISLQTANGEPDWPFLLSIEGKWRDPFEANLTGTWAFMTPEFRLNLDTFQGTVAAYPFSLSSPVQLRASSDQISLKDFELNIQDSTLQASLERSASNTFAALKLEQFPLELLSPPDVSISGTLNFEGSLKEIDHRLQGGFNALIEQMDVSSSAENTFTSGKFEGTYDRERLDLSGELSDLLCQNKTVSGSEDKTDSSKCFAMKLSASLPLHLEIWPFKSHFLPASPAKGNLTYNGPVQDILDFLDLGSHRLDGELNCDLTLSNTLRYPVVEGTCQLQNGTYQNYYTGTQLYNIQANWQAKSDTLYLRSLTAQDGPSDDPNTGALTASGKVHLRPSSLPFRFDVDFTKLNFVQIDLVDAEANGHIEITGDLNSALAKGSVEVTDATLTIPNRIPKTLPQLKVVYRNPTQPVVLPETTSQVSYPLELDLQVKAPEVAIGGRGLDSNWKGNFHVQGLYTAIATKGNLELLSGQFVFSDRTFKLENGALSFSGKEHEMPYLKLSGSVTQKGILITASLTGPLNNPQLTFQSTPPLPLSTIMSYLLFGQDTSEINGFEALQLASSLATLSGTGADVLENTRRSLGIDRLKILTSEDSDGSTSIAVQVGKYVSEGVLVTYSQGADDSSANISIEVEIGDNFIFQAETQQQQEQGKFTLKWNRNY